MSNPVTLARTGVVLYAATIIALAFFFIPGSDRTKHFTARRYLGANTRLSERLLVKPSNTSIDENFSLNQEFEKLNGKYIRKDVEAMKAVTPDNVTDWPILAPTETFPVEMATEPDWMFMNQGSLVQVWIGNNPTPQRAAVLAILPSDKKWVALLKRQDVSAVLAGSKEPHVVKLEVVAGAAAPTPDSSPLPVPSPTQWPAPLLSPTPK